MKLLQTTINFKCIFSSQKYKHDQWCTMILRVPGIWHNFCQFFLPQYYEKTHLRSQKANNKNCLDCQYRFLIHLKSFKVLQLFKISDITQFSFIRKDLKIRSRARTWNVSLTRLVPYHWAIQNLNKNLLESEEYIQLHIL